MPRLFHLDIVEKTVDTFYICSEQQVVSLLRENWLIVEETSRILHMPKTPHVIEFLMMLRKNALSNLRVK